MRCLRPVWLQLGLVLLLPVSVAASATTPETEPAVEEAAVQSVEAPADSSTSEPDQKEDLSVEQILTTPSTDTEGFGESLRCIPTRRVKAVHVLDASHVVFDLGRGTYYLVQFETRCPLLERDATISYEVDGKLCRLDAIRPIYGVGYNARLGPPCQIPGFQELSRDQLLLIREQLKNTRTRPDLIETPESDDKPE